MTFTFPDGTAVKAQKNALIANSSVFEVILHLNSCIEHWLSDWCLLGAI